MSSYALWFDLLFKNNPRMIGFIHNLKRIQSIQSSRMFRLCFYNYQDFKAEIKFENVQFETFFQIFMKNIQKQQKIKYQNLSVRKSLTHPFSRYLYISKVFILCIVISFRIESNTSMVFFLSVLVNTLFTLCHFEWSCFHLHGM